MSSTKDLIDDDEELQAYDHYVREQGYSGIDDYLLKNKHKLCKEDQKLLDMMLAKS